MPTPFINYSRRTGVTTFRALIVALCKLYEKFKPTITTWINVNIVDPTYKTQVESFLGLLSDVCYIVGVTLDD